MAAVLCEYSRLKSGINIENTSTMAIGVTIR
jgi:hypothetical protein